jgi:hypothetical protein
MSNAGRLSQFGVSHLDPKAQVKQHNPPSARAGHGNLNNAGRSCSFTAAELCDSTTTDKGAVPGAGSTDIAGAAPLQSSAGPDQQLLNLSSTHGTTASETQSEVQEACRPGGLGVRSSCGVQLLDYAAQTELQSGQEEHDVSTFLQLFHQQHDALVQHLFIDNVPIEIVGIRM